jgi:hypothetical protein
VSHPNLFDYATSELSQDAVICWLLEWADPKFSTADPKLHNVGKAFVEALLAKHGVSLPEGIQSVEVVKQYRKVDAYAVINRKFGLLIEDKVHAGRHGNQLERYIQEIAAHRQEQLCPIYLKTGNQSCYTEEARLGFKPFERQDFLHILREGHKAGISNAIFVDFYAHLQRIEDQTQAFLTTPLDQWGERMTQGFYMTLKTHHFPNASWDYVSNPQGGLWVFTIGYSNKATEPFCYIELERNLASNHKKPFILCFKVFSANLNNDEKQVLRQGLLK